MALAVIGVLAALAVTAGAARAATCDGTWTGATSSQWGVASNWSPATVPGGASATSNVCLPASGANYPVQLAPFAYTDPASGVQSIEHGAEMNNLSIAGGAGLVVYGESFGDRGDTYSDVALAVDGTGTVASGGSLELLATNVTTTSNGTGGRAILTGRGSVTNAGSFSAASVNPEATENDTTYHNRLDLGFTNAPGSTATVSSGYLDIDGATVTNQSQWTIAAGATENIVHNGLVAPQADFVNQGSYADAGTTIVGGTGFNNETPDIFTQSGPESGNPVDLRVGSELNDASGTGSFLMNDQNSQLAGTIPAGQTVTIEGDLYNTDTFTNFVTLEGNQVVNQGTLVLSTPNASPDTYPDTVVNGATLVNQGTINTTDAAPALFNEIDASVQNQHGGAVNVQGGQLHFGGNGQTVTNDGTMTVAPAAQIYGDNSPFNGGPVTFINAADGTLVPQIASATSFGTFRTDTNETFNVGGTAAPQLVGGYTPAVGTSFAVFPETSGSSSKIAGSFGAIGAGFSADYSKETVNPGGINLLYSPAPPASPPTNPTPPKAPTKSSVPGSHKPSVKGSKILIKLSCPKGNGCRKATVTVTVLEKVKTKRGKIKTEKVVVAKGSGTPKAGRSKTVTLKLNRRGAKLLTKAHHLKVKVSVSVAGKIRKTYAVSLSRHRKSAKRHHGGA